MVSLLPVGPLGGWVGDGEAVGSLVAVLGPLAGPPVAGAPVAGAVDPVWPLVLGATASVEVGGASGAGAGTVDDVAGAVLTGVVVALPVSPV